MKILDREVEFDFSDVESYKRYENALEKYMQSIQETKQLEGKEGVGREKLCKIVYDFFDDLLGQGSAIQILGEKPNFKRSLEAMYGVLEEKQKSDKEISDILGKYDINNEFINS